MRATGNQNVEVVIADLTLQADVRRAAAEFLARHDRLHVLVNDAGAIYGTRALTPDGVERTWRSTTWRPSCSPDCSPTRSPAAPPRAWSPSPPTPRARA